MTHIEEITKIYEAQTMHEETPELLEKYPKCFGLFNDMDFKPYKEYFTQEQITEWFIHYKKKREMYLDERECKDNDSIEYRGLIFHIQRFYAEKNPRGYYKPNNAWASANGLSSMDQFYSIYNIVAIEPKWLFADVIWKGLVKPKTRDIKRTLDGIITKNKLGNAIAKAALKIRYEDMPSPV